MKDTIKLFKYIDKWLLSLTIILFAIGTVMIFSSSNISSYMRYATSPYYYLIRQLVILGIGLVISIMIMFVNVRVIRKASTFINYALVASLFLLFVFGTSSNDALRWFSIGSFSFQPSEFIKVFTIIWLAHYYDKNKEKLSGYVVSLYPIFICIISFLAIAMQPDLGTALIYGMIVGVIFLISGIDKKIKRRIIFLVGGLALVAALVFTLAGNSLLSERQMSRIESAFSSSSPCSEENYYTTGNQVCNGYIAINNGGLFGLGLGKSIQKYLYLPESHTDFIFCIIIEELGLVFGIFIIFLYVLLLGRIIMIGRRSTNNCNAVICYGGAFYIFIHIVVNLSGIFGILPMTGAPLPFMSYGGSYTLCLMILLAVIQRINMETKIKTVYEKRGENKKNQKNSKKGKK